MLTSINKSSYISSIAGVSAAKQKAAQSVEAIAGGSGVSFINDLKTTIAKGLLTKQLELAKSVTQVEPTDVSQGSNAMSAIEVFDSALSAFAGVDESSTKERPIVRVELTDEGGTSAYLVDMNEVDDAKMTKIEAIAMIRHMQAKDDWSDLTYADMLAAISSTLGDGSEADDEGTLGQIGQYIKSSGTYGSNGAYSAPQSAAVSFFEQTSAERMGIRAMRLRDLLSKIVVADDGKKSLAPGIYL